MKYTATIELVSITCSDTESITSGDQVVLDGELTCAGVRQTVTTPVLDISGDGMPRVNGIHFSAPPLFTMECGQDENQHVTGRIRLVERDGGVLDPDDVLGQYDLDVPISVFEGGAVELLAWEARQRDWTGWKSWKYQVVLRITRAPAFHSVNLSASPAAVRAGTQTPVVITGVDIATGQAVSGIVEIATSPEAPTWLAVGKLGEPFTCNVPSLEVTRELFIRATGVPAEKCFDYYCNMVTLPILPPPLIEVPVVSPRNIDKFLELLVGNVMDLYEVTRLGEMVVSVVPTMVLPSPKPQQVLVYARDKADPTKEIDGKVVIGSQTGRTSTSAVANPLLVKLPSTTMGKVTAPGYRDADFPLPLALPVRPRRR